MRGSRIYQKLGNLGFTPDFIIGSFGFSVEQIDLLPSLGLSFYVRNMGV